MEERQWEHWFNKHRRFGTEPPESAPLPAMPPSQGTETPEQLEEQRRLITGYICSDPRSSSGVNKARCLIMMNNRLASDRRAFELQYGREWVAALECTLGRSYLVRALLDTKQVQHKLASNRAKVAELAEKVRSERDLRARAESRADRLELDKKMDAPFGWVYRERKERPGIYINAASGKTSTVNPRAAEKLAGIKRLADETGALRKRVRELEAQSVSGSNYVACAKCRQLLSGDRPGGKGRFIFVESVACTVCNPSAYYCNNCAKDIGWTITRKTTKCPSC